MPLPVPSIESRHDALPLDGPDPGDHTPLAALLLDCLASGLEPRFQVRGASMVPFLRDGDIVRATPTQPGDLCPAAIVLAIRDDGTLLVHRITAVRRGPDGILCRLRGDAHVADDGWFGPERIPGVVRCIRRGKRQFETGRLTMRVLGRIWMTYSNARAWTLRLADHLLRGIRSKRRAAD